MSDTVRNWRKAGYGSTVIGALITIVLLFPVFWMVSTSLKTSAGVFETPPRLIPNPVSFDAYQTAVIDNPAVLQALISSVIVSLGTMLLTLILATPAAYGIARLNLKLGPAVLLLLLITQLLPSIVMAGPLFVVFSRLHLVNSYQALILADTTFTLPFAVIIIRPFFLSIPRDLEAAAMVDGANRWEVFLRIVLPLVRPGLVTVAAFTFLFAWGEFVFALALNTNDGIQPITVALNKLIGQYGVQWNKLMAVSTAIALPIVIMFAGLQRFIVGGLIAGGAKE